MRRILLYFMPAYLLLYSFVLSALSFHTDRYKQQRPIIDKTDNILKGQPRCLARLSRDSQSFNFSLI